MSKQGSITTANYIDYDKALNKGLSLMEQKIDCFYFNYSKMYREEIIGFYIITSINVGLRIGDILELTFEDFRKGHKTFREQKTGKAKTVVFNETILKAFNKSYFSSNRTGYVFTSQKGSVYSRQQINRLLKEIFKSKDKNISSHSLRKTFGRRVYEKNNESDKALLMLNEIYNHSSIAQTRKYLDITQDEINSVYESIC
jgi:integrase